MKALMGKKKKQPQPAPVKSDDDSSEPMDLATIMDQKRQSAWEEDVDDDAPVRDEKSSRFWASRRTSNPHRVRVSESAKHLLDDLSVDKEGHVEYQGEPTPELNLAYEKNPSRLVLDQIPDQDQSLETQSSDSTTRKSNVLSPTGQPNRDPMAASRSLFNGSTRKQQLPPLTTPNIPTPSPRANMERKPSPMSEEDSSSTFHGSFVTNADGTKQRKSKMEKIRELLHENRELKESYQRMQEELIAKEERLRQLDGSGGQLFTGEGTKESPDRQGKEVEALLALTATTRKQQESIAAHQARYDQLMKEFESSQAEVKQLTKEIARHKKQVLVLDKEIDANLLEINSLRNELSKALNSVEELEEVQKVDRDKILNFAKELALTKAGMSGASDDIIAIAEEMENYALIVKERDDEIEAQRSELQEHMEQIQQLQLDLEKAQEQIEDYERERDTTVREMETYYEALKHELEEKNRLLEAVEREKHEVATETTESMRALQVRCDDLSSQLSEAHRDIDAMKHDRGLVFGEGNSQNGFAEERERLNANLEAMSAELDEMADYYQKMELEQADARQELEEEVGELRMQLTEFKAALREATVRNRTLTEKNEILRTENISLLEISQDLQNKLREDQRKQALGAAAIVGSAALASEASKKAEKIELKEVHHHQSDSPASAISSNPSNVEEQRSQNEHASQTDDVKDDAESSSSSDVGRDQTSESVDSGSLLSGTDKLDAINENETDLGDSGVVSEAGDDNVIRANLSDDSKVNNSSSSSTGVSDDAVVKRMPSPLSDQAAQQDLFLQAAANRQKAAEKLNMANRSWRSMKLFSQSSVSALNKDKSSSSRPQGRSNSLPPFSAGDMSSSDSSAVDTSVVDLLKDQVIESLEKSNQAHQDTIKELKSELIRLNASYKDEAYLSKKKIESLTQENSAYEIKVVVLQKTLEKLGGPVESYFIATDTATADTTGRGSSPVAEAGVEQETPQRDWSSPPKFHDRIKELEQQVATLEKEKLEAESKVHAVESDLESFQRTTKQSAIASIREIERLQQENAEYERKLASLVQAGLEATEGALPYIFED